MKSSKKLLLAAICLMASTYVSAQKYSADLEKFGTFRMIKDTVTSFAPLQDLIDCGFRHLKADPKSDFNGLVISMLTSNTETGISDMKDATKYSMEWATYVAKELDNAMKDRSLTKEQKAIFALMKANRAMNALPIPAKITSQMLKKTRAEFDNVYQLSPDLPCMVLFEKRYETLIGDFFSHGEIAAHRQSMAMSKNKGVSDFYARKIKETKEQFKLKFIAVDGREVDIEKLKGKVILVDFWATWCAPCVKEMPHVIETYRKYHDKGFEVIGISLDTDKARLEAYTAKNGMPWPQYFDGKRFDNAIGLQYGVERVPTAYIIDRDGTIYTKNARGVELDRAMGELFR